MQITTHIEVVGDSYPYTEEAAAAQVLAALGGNPANDASTCHISFHQLRISTSVTLEQDDSMAYTPDGAATQVLAALGGNPTTDRATVVMNWANVAGEAGASS